MGWALGDGREHGDDPAWDAAEAEALYDLLEREVIPEFYARDAAGIPTAWMARMRESMAQSDAAVLDEPGGARIHRALLPAGGNRLPARAAGQGALGRQIVDWRHRVAQHWEALRFAAFRARPRRVAICSRSRSC